jgi:hypothetical protein
VTSSAVVAVGALFLASLPSTFGEARRYDAADVCAGDGGEPPRCRELVPAVVERRYSTNGGKGGDDHVLELRVGETATFGPLRHPKRVEIEDTVGDPVDDDRAAPVYDALREGDRVEVTYWGRQLTRVTKPGVGSVETIASPTFDVGVTLGLGPLLPVLGAFGWWGALDLRRRSGSWRRKAAFAERRSVPAYLGIGAVFGISLFVVAIQGSAGTDVGLIVVAWVLGAIGGAALAGTLVGIGAVVRRLRD